MRSYFLHVLLDFFNNNEILFTKDAELKENYGYKRQDT